MQLLVFDIETAPFKAEEYSDVQLQYINKKLSAALGRNPNLDPLAEEGKIKGTDPYLSRIVCIGLYYPDRDLKVALTDQDEKVLLQRFWSAIASFNGLFVSYNGVKFDVPYILKRSMKYGIYPTNNLFLQYTKYDPFPPHFDVMLQLCGREWYYGLKEACDFLGVPSPKEGAVTASGVEAAFYSGRINEIAEYCLRDLESTYKIYEIVKHYVGRK